MGSVFLWKTYLKAAINMSVSFAGLALISRWSEELGLIGALIIIILFALLVWRGISISLKAKDKFGSLLGIGLSAQVGLQVILNIAVVTNTIPNTGISLPFFSYGGTSLVILLAQMGVVLSISRTSMIEKG